MHIDPQIAQICADWNEVQNGWKAAGWRGLTSGKAPKQARSADQAGENVPTIPFEKGRGKTREIVLRAEIQSAKICEICG